MVCVLLEFVWIPLMLPFGTPWSLTYFRFNVVLAFILILVTAAIATFLPIWEGVSAGKLVRHLAASRMHAHARTHALTQAGRQAGT